MYRRRQPSNVGAMAGCHGQAGSSTKQGAARGVRLHYALLPSQHYSSLAASNSSSFLSHLLPLSLQLNSSIARIQGQLESERSEFNRVVAQVWCFFSPKHRQ